MTADAAFLGALRTAGLVDALSDLVAGTAFMLDAMLALALGTGAGNRYAPILNRLYGILLLLFTYTAAWCLVSTMKLAPCNHLPMWPCCLNSVWQCCCYAAGDDAKANLDVSHVLMAAATTTANAVGSRSRSPMRRASSAPRFQRLLGLMAGLDCLAWLVHGDPESARIVGHKVRCAALCSTDAARLQRGSTAA